MLIKALAACFLLSLIAPKADCVPTCPRYVPEECDFSKCPKDLKCPGGIVKDYCGCCDICAKQRGEVCGGAKNYLGRCDRRLVCELDPKVNEVFRADTGVCRTKRDKMRCWTCTDMNSLGECYTKGQLKNCNYNQKACQTHIRHDVTGLKYSMECKQTQACSNNRVQNGRRAYRKTQCDLSQINSVCRCCCGHDRCNMDPKYQCFYETDYNRHDCVFPFEYFGEVYHSCTTKDWYTPWCSQDTIYTDNYVNCERYHGEGCVFPFVYKKKTFHSCTDYDWHEPWCSLTYKYKGEWKPCKPVVNERSCERFRLKLDLMIVLDASSTIKESGNWDTEVKVASNIIRNIVIEKWGTKVGIVHYNRAVNTTSEILLNTNTSLHDLDVHLHTVPPKRGFGTLTGKALKHVLDSSFSQEHGNRPDVADVLILITDGRSQDEVVHASAALRRKGVVVYTVLVPSNGDRGQVSHTLEREEFTKKLNVPAPNLFMWDLKTTSPYNVHEAILDKMVQDDFCPRCTPLVNPDPENIDITCTDDNLVGSVCWLQCKNADTQGVTKTQCRLNYGTQSSWIPEINAESTFCNTCPRVPVKPFVQETECKTTNFTNGCQYSCDYSDAMSLLTKTLDNGCDDHCCIPQQCLTHKLLDLLFVVDSSSSIDGGEWNSMMNFINDIASRFEVGHESVRVGMFRYGRTIDETNQIFMKDTSSLGDFKATIESFKKLKTYSGTATGLAMKHAALNHLTPEAGDRPGVPNVVLVITDGKNNDYPYNGAKSGSEKRERLLHKNQNILKDGFTLLSTKHQADVFSVGVSLAKGKDTQNLLKAISGGIDDHFLTINNWGLLKGETQINQIIKLVQRSCGQCAEDETYIPRLIYACLAQGEPVDASYGFVTDAVRDNRDNFTGFEDWYKQYVATRA